MRWRKKARLQLAEQQVSQTRIRRHVNAVGAARLAERDAAVEQLGAMDLPVRRKGCEHQEAPEVAVVMMDGGRYQRRDHFAARGELARNESRMPPCDGQRGSAGRPVSVHS
jgi:hypothetical protein